MNSSVASVLLTSNQIHIPHAADTDLLELAEGHLLRATVQRVADEMALLNFGGKALMVHTDVPLQAQQRVILQVTQVGPEKVSLQIVQQSAPPSSDTAASAPPLLPPSSLENLLTTWGLTPDTTNQTIAKALFAHSQTLNPDTIQDVRTIWQQLPALTSLPADGGGKAGHLEAVVYLHTNQLPITSESIALARHLLDNSFPIAQRLTTLHLTLQSVQSHLQTVTAQLSTSTGQPQAQPAATPAPPLATLLSQINTVLEHLSNWSISDKTPPEHVAARLAQIITQLSTPPESQLAPPTTSTPNPTQLLNGGGERGASPVLEQNLPVPASPESETPAPQTATATQPASRPAAHQAAPPAEPATGQTTTQTDGRPAPPVTHPQAAAPDAPTVGPGRVALPETVAPLQRLAAAVSQALSNANLDEPTVHALRQLSGQLEAVAKDLGAVQISNLTQAPNPANQPYFLFPIPLQTVAGPRTAHLRVFRPHDSGHQPLDPKNLRLALLLDLPELGEIAINLTVFEKHLSGKIISGREQTHQRVQADLPDLDHSLRRLGYYVDSLTADRLPVQKKSIFEEPESLERIEVPLPQINITA